MSYSSGTQVGYGLSNALQTLAPEPIIANRNPLTSDSAPALTLWLNKLTSATFVCAGTKNGVTTWDGIGGSSGTFTSITVTGATVLGGALTVNSGTNAINIGTDAVQKAIVVGNATGNTSVAVNVGTGALNLGTDATAHATAVGTTTAGGTLALNTPTGTKVVAANGLSITTAGVGLSLPGGVLVLSGTGAPTAVTAPQGSLYLRTDGSSTSTRAYINTDAGTTWTAITTAA
jgi:hypothetical protein